MTPTRLALLALAFLAAPLAGCLGGDETNSDESYISMGFDGTHWPDLRGETVTILDHGSFEWMFGPTKALFENLTGAKLEHIAAQDTGDALNRAIREKDAPSFDVVYGLDNAYLGQAVKAGALQPYTPLLAHRVNPDYVFFDADQPWPATPADHGYIAVNVDPRIGIEVQGLADVRDNADLFVTEDPRFSSPGLGFLLATIATYPQSSPYNWQDYWIDLFDNGVTVMPDWETAYGAEFTGSGSAQLDENWKGTRAIVTSYTTSPAYEEYYARVNEYDIERADVLLAPKSTFHQIETVAIAANTKHLAAAQAFVEFVLTDDFQDLHAVNNAVYPVVDGIDVAKVYAGLDPAPGSFQPAILDYETIGANVETWVRQWTDLYEAHQA